MNISLTNKDAVQFAVLIFCNAFQFVKVNFSSLLSTCQPRMWEFQYCATKFRHDNIIILKSWLTA